MPAWAHRTTLNAVDITAQTLGGATVDEAENVSHVADLVWFPPSGTQDSDALIGQTLSIELDTGTGFKPLFDGRVIRAEWDQRERLYRIRASNRIQEYFRALGTHAAVLAALPGAVYSEALFGEPPDDLWEYAQRCLETLEQDAHINRTSNLELVDWAAKDTQDFTIAIGQVHNNGAFTLQRPDLDETVNTVTIEYQYRVSRWKTRIHGIGWSAWRNNTPISNWCEWFSGPNSAYQFPPLPIELAQSVLLGSSWATPGGLAYSISPPGDLDPCGDGVAWVPFEHHETYCYTCSATGYRSLSQPITETYKLTIHSTAAQTLYGTSVTDTRSGSTNVEADLSWPPENAQPPDAGWATDTIGDRYQDQDDETLRAGDLQAAYQWAGWRVRGAMRQTSLVIRTDLTPDITLAHTVEVHAYGLQARGKVRRMRHVLDSATPYVEITVALSRGGGGTTTPWTVPARPDTNNPGYPAPPASTSLNTYVGNWPGAGAAPNPDDRVGWITNVGSWLCNPPEDPCAEPEEIWISVFRAEWPEVEDAAAEERALDVPSTWDLACPQDLLVIT